MVAAADLAEVDLATAVAVDLVVVAAADAGTAVPTAAPISIRHK